MTDTIDVAIADLAMAGVPFIEDQLEGVGPMGCLYFAMTTVQECLRHWTAELSTDQAGATEGIDEMTPALDAITLALGNLVHACVVTGIMPPEGDENPVGHG